MIRTGLKFLVLLFFTSSTFAQIPARARSCCGLMNGKIYCYGGDVYTTTTNYVHHNGMNVLDLTNKSGTLATELPNMWQPVSYNINNVDLTNRVDAQCAILEGGKQMLINGGYDSVGPRQLTNLNIAYNVDSNQWDALPDYREPPFGRRQINFGSATVIPGKGVAFYGGYEAHINASWSVPSTGNLSVLNFDNPPTSRYVGYTQVAMFQQKNQTNPWSLLSPLQDAFMATEFSAGQTSVFDPVNNLIVFMGGGYRRNDPPTLAYTARPFNNISAVNVSDGTWRQLTPTGDLPKPKRVFTTATLLPSTNRHVLLFGGEIQDANVCLEYCFTLNLDTYKWKRHVIAAPSGTILQRSRHSAVLVNNETLFIMWGRDTNNAGINSILILNVSNPDNIVLSNKYVAPNAPNADQDAQGNTATNDDGSSSSTDPGKNGHSGMSTGTKAGIAVACIVAAILGLASIWFCLRNKKNKKTIRNQQRELAAQRQYRDEQEDAIPMEVDWDRIENKYTEIPPMYTLQNHANTANDDYYMGSSNSFNMETLVDNTKLTSIHPLPPDGVESQNPHTIESSDKNAQSSLQSMNHSVKPDGVINSKHTSK